MSAPSPGRAVVNAGSKVFSGDVNPNILPNLRLEGYGNFRDAITRDVLPDVVLTSLSEEHGSLSFDPEQHEFAVGDVVDIFPAHLCTCVNLANALVFVRDGVVTEVLDVGTSGHLVVPGSIDVHTHIETALLEGPHRHAAGRMGVKTVLSGPT